MPRTRPARPALPPDPPSLPTPRQRRKQERPHELLAAALTLFGEKGFAAARIEEVAALAGVSKGTLYLYYPSKEELLKAVVREHLGELIAAGEELVAAFEGPTAQLLTTLLRTWWDRVGDTPASAIHKIMLSEARNFPEIARFYNDEVIGPANRMLANCIQRGIDRGEFRPVAVRPAAMNLLAPVIFLMLHKHSFAACPFGSDGVDPAAVISSQIDLALHGLLQRGDNAAEPSPSTPS